MFLINKFFSSRQFLHTKLSMQARKNHKVSCGKSVNSFKYEQRQTKKKKKYLIIIQKASAVGVMWCMDYDNKWEKFFIFTIAEQL